MRAAIIVFPGSNREGDAKAALTAAFGAPPIMVWHRDSELPKVDLILVPGGFSYGDYLRCGAIAAHSPILREVKAKAAAGVTVIGVCNGFQILVEAGLLPGILLRNAGLKFVCRNVGLRVESGNSPFTWRYQKGQVLSIPIAHHDGNYFADPETLDRLEAEDRIAFRYCAADGRLDARANPNGSARHIAGILNEKRNVLGLMPHPENAVFTEQGSTDGKALFESLAGAVA